MVVYNVDMSLGFASTIGAYDTTEYSGEGADNIDINTETYTVLKAKGTRNSKTFSQNF
jgi:hypothetical protein